MLVEPLPPAQIFFEASPMPDAVIRNLGNRQRWWKPCTPAQIFSKHDHNHGNNHDSSNHGHSQAKTQSNLGG